MTNFPFTMSSGPIALVVREQEVQLGAGVSADLRYQGPTRMLAAPKTIPILSGKSSCAELDLPEGGRLRIWLVIEGISLLGHDVEGAPVWRIDTARCIHETTLPPGATVDGIPPREATS